MKRQRNGFFLCLLLCFVSGAAFAEQLNNDRVVKETVFKNFTINVMGYEGAENIIYPQIKNPQHPAQEKWNQSIRSTFVKGVDRVCDGNPAKTANVSFDIIFASKKILSLKIKDWYACDKAAHGFGGTHYENVVFSAQSASHLELENVFMSGKKTEWEQALLSNILEHLKSPRNSMPMDEKNYASKVIQNNISKYGFTNWGISKKGIEFNFGIINGYAGGEYYAQVPWQNMQPYIIPEFYQTIRELP